MINTMYLLISIKYLSVHCKNVVKMTCRYCQTYKHVHTCLRVQYVCVKVSLFYEVQFLVVGFVVL
jgi:hypothetical protein